MGRHLILHRAAMVLVAFVGSSPGHGGEIHDAARNGDLRKLQALLKGHSELVSSKDGQHMTPLHWAAREGQLEVTKWLLTNGADVSARDDTERMPLEVLRGGGDIWVLLRTATYPMHMAAQGGYFVRMKRLLQSNPELVSAKDNYGEMPLHYAAEAGEMDVVKLLLLNGADVNAKTEFGRTALHYAVQKAHPDVVAFLLVKGVEVNARDRDGNTALHSVEGCKEIAKLLLAGGAEVNAKGEFGETPLCRVASCGAREVAEVLLAHGADVTASNEFGWTPLHLAAEYGHKAVAELLLANKAAINALTDQEGTPLSRAIARNHPDVAELLLARGARYDIRDAVDLGDLKRIEALLKENPELVSFRDKYTAGTTPMFWAVAQGRKDIAELLLTYKADVNGLDDSGFTPLHRAAEFPGMWGSEAMKEWLRQHGGHE